MSPESSFFSPPAPRSIFLPLWQTYRIPLSLLRLPPPAPPAPFPCPSLLQRQAQQTLDLGPPTPPPGRPPRAAGNLFSWPPRPQRTKSESVVTSRGKNVQPRRPLSKRDGRAGRGKTCQPPLRRISHLGLALLETQTFSHRLRDRQARCRDQHGPRCGARKTGLPRGGAVLALAPAGEAQ